MPSFEMKRIFEKIKEYIHELVSSLGHSMINTRTITVGQLA